MDIGYIKLVVSHAAAVHGIAVSVEPINLARIALKRRGLVGKSRERDRRPTQEELERLLTFFENNRRQLLPIARIIRFALATAMRQEEICRIHWQDIDAANGSVSFVTAKILEGKTVTISECDCVPLALASHGQVTAAVPTDLRIGLHGFYIMRALLHSFRHLLTFDRLQIGFHDQRTWKRDNE